MDENNEELSQGAQQLCSHSTSNYMYVARIIELK